MINLDKETHTLSDEEMQKLVNQVYDHAADLYINQNYSWWEVETELVNEGLSPENAKTVVENLKEHEKEAKRQGANKHIRNGALWCGGGLLLTAITGGQYIFFGAVIYGGFLLIRGLYHKSL